MKYSMMASRPESRKIFVDSVVEFIERYGFDGLDLDWEYPGSRGGKPEDKRNLVELLRELKAAFTPKGYLLTSAVSAGKLFIDPAYDIPMVSQYLDLINVMCYDYHGGWEDKTGHNAPLYGRPDEPAGDQILNVNYSINYWISKGAPRSKIVLGMGTYGRSFTLQKAENNGLWSPAPQKGQAGPYTREPGSLGYNEICEMKSRKNTMTEVRDPYYMAPYAYTDRQWFGYDDVDSITLKAQYIKAMQLGGGMIWSIETDDFKGKCGEKYPLLNAINKVFKSNEIVMPLPKPSDSEDVEVNKPVTQSTTTTTTAKPWVWAQSSTTASSSWPVWSTPSTSMTWWPRPSSTPSPSSQSSTWWPQQPSVSSVIWWQPTSSSSSSSHWSWAPTHPVHQSSTPTKAEEMTSPSTPITSSTPGHEVEEDPSPSSSSTSSPPSSWGPPSSSPSSWGPPSPPSWGGPPNPDNFVCPGPGIFKHQTDCQKFYRCIQTPKDGLFLPYPYSCPAKTVFNPTTNLCDWVENVPECTKRVPNNFFRFHNSHRNVS
ncbi:acidic mammalian chitinase-like [Oppia nitens]|uniref:acidic mammalian chitinase-like n=1 Tax=Oppia nitens TaxID=1686743 RepID=UPI0023DB14F9|nr:acidic mammalian chitinase-like [Oppia nitens]